MKQGRKVTFSFFSEPFRIALAAATRAAFAAAAAALHRYNESNNVAFLGNTPHSIHQRIRRSSFSSLLAVHKTTPNTLQRTQHQSLRPHPVASHAPRETNSSARRSCCLLFLFLVILLFTVQGAPRSHSPSHACGTSLPLLSIHHFTSKYQSFYPSIPLHLILRPHGQVCTNVAPQNAGNFAAPETFESVGIDQRWTPERFAQVLFSRPNFKTTNLI